ncbi:MAG: hypothetical protein HKO90_05440, partial [Flavobacteriaceae bacterium]|nr:hypothetical protein [Flavobacteriaceae bacterium]
MKTFVSILFVFCSFSLFAQYQITIEAKVVNEDTREPIPFANVEFVDTPVTKTTSEDGTFSMTYDEAAVNTNNLFLVSAFGYESQDITAQDFYKFLRNTNTIYLRQKPGLSDAITSAVNSDKSSSEHIEKALSGSIFVKSIPVQGAKISIKNSFTETVSGPDGEFDIDAEIGDVLVVKYLGMVTEEIQVKDFNRKEITMVSDGELLEEVLLNGLNEEKPKLNLGYNGKKHFDEITYSAGVISPKEIKSNYYQLSDLLNGRLSKLAYSRNGSINLPSSYIYDIDGMVYTSESNIQLPWL